MDTETAKTLEAMMVYGSGFVRSLARCMGQADPENFARLKAAFPELWRDYLKIAQGKDWIEPPRG